MDNLAFLPPAPDGGPASPVPDPHYEMCLDAWQQSDLGKGDHDLPGMLAQAYERAQDEAQVAEIRQAIEHLGRATAGQATGARSKTPIIAEVCRCADPGLFFPWAQDRPEITRELLQRAAAELKDLCPGRGSQIEELLIFSGRRLRGDEDARYPLLYGPPSTGKTVILELLAEVLTDCDLPARGVYQPMTQMGHSVQNPEVNMTLQGTSSHWGDGRPGMLYHEAARRGTQACLTVLDEADKCSQLDYLVTLLDPRAALADNFVREFFPGMDMRHKCLFFLTANDIRGLSSNAALWSRVLPIDMPEYSRPEVVELVAALVSRRVDGIQPGEIAATVEQILDTADCLPSVRVLVDLVRREIFRQEFDFLVGVDPTASAGPATIGFR